MAGHSQFKNIMYRKGAQDVKKAKIFTKIAREITIAAKSGSSDPKINARLKAAIADARSCNMPKDNIERAIKKADHSDENFEFMRYEGYGPLGTAFIVEALTDNKNRTASELRSCFTKHKGSLGEDGCVIYNFEYVGYIVCSNYLSVEKTIEGMLDSGKDIIDCYEEDERLIIVCAPELLHDNVVVVEALIGEPESYKRIWQPKSLIDVHENDLPYRLIEAIEDIDDVQSVFANIQ